MESNQERSKCSRYAAALPKINDDILGLTLFIFRVMDLQNAYCVKGIRCTWLLVLIHTPLVPTGRGTEHFAADARFICAHTLIGFLQSGSKWRNRTYRPSTGRHSTYRKISFRSGYRCDSSAQTSTKSGTHIRSHCIKALSNQYSWTRCILWAEQWNAQSSPLPSSYHRMKRN